MARPGMAHQGGRSATPATLAGSLRETRAPTAVWSPATDSATARLAGAERAAMQRWLRRMALYEPLIRSALARRGMPEELIYVALIESGFSPHAESPAGAMGIWQFMAGTARAVGLEVGPRVDERQDPARATEAALTYLSELHTRFGSWHLALAAYNAGPGRLERVLHAQARPGRGQNGLYWQIRPFLPPETQAYVPRVLAAARIGAAPARWGFATAPVHQTR